MWETKVGKLQLSKSFINSSFLVRTKVSHFYSLMDGVVTIANTNIPS